MSAITAQWMYGDCNRFAYRDPMRWSAWMPVGDLVQQLSGGGSCSSYDRKRPVYLKLNISRPETRYAHTNEHILQATEEQVRKIEAFPHLDGASAIVELKSLMALIQILSTESMTESVAIEFSNLGFTNNVMNQQALAACGGNFKDAVALLCQQERFAEVSSTKLVTGRGV